MNTNTRFILTGLLGLLIGIGGSFVALQEGNGDDDGHRMADESMTHGSMDMNDEMDGMMKSLNGKMGDEFDKVFLREMIVHHQGAVVMAQAALKSSKHQEIKDLAQAIITAQNTEIKQMQDWQKDWYGQ